MPQRSTIKPATLYKDSKQAGVSISNYIMVSKITFILRLYSSLILFFISGSQSMTWQMRDASFLVSVSNIKRPYFVTYTSSYSYGLNFSKHAATQSVIQRISSSMLYPTYMFAYSKVLEAHSPSCANRSGMHSSRQD